MKKMRRTSLGTLRHRAMNKVMLHARLEAEADLKGNRSRTLKQRRLKEKAIANNRKLWESS